MTRRHWIALGLLIALGLAYVWLALWVDERNQRFFEAWNEPRNWMG